MKALPDATGRWRSRSQSRGLALVLIAFPRKEREAAMETGRAAGARVPHDGSPHLEGGAPIHRPVQCLEPQANERESMASTTRRRRRSWKKTLVWLIGAAIVLFVLIQFVPYGRTSHTNPPATNPFQWSDPQAKALAKAACYDCHSNQTNWWWATNIAPFSWVVQHDVDQARGIANFSDYTGLPSVDEFAHAVTDNMPPIQYTLLHPNAKTLGCREADTHRRLPERVRREQRGDVGRRPIVDPATAGTADGAALVQARCSACHSAPTSYHAGSTAEAQALIENMIQRGASVSPAEEQALIAYFTR